MSSKNINPKSSSSSTLNQQQFSKGNISNAPQRPPGSADQKQASSPVKGNRPASGSQMNLPQEVPADPIHNMIHEYLLKNGMQQTLEIFQNQLLHGSNEPQPLDQYESLLMTYFGKGQRDNFMALWEKFIPINMRFADDQTNQIEFYLQIYFLIFPIHPVFQQGGTSNVIDKNSKQQFKNYLDTKGAHLSQTNEFLQFYALPYIEKPQEHQALRHLFSAEWVNELQGQLLDYITNVFTADSQPFLNQLYEFYYKNNFNSHPNPNLNINPNNQQGGSPMKKQQSMQQLGGNANQNDRSYFDFSTSKDVSQVGNYIRELESGNQELIAIVNDLNNKYNNLQKTSRAFAESAKSSLLDSQNQWFSVAQDLVSISKSLLRMIEENVQKHTPFNSQFIDSHVQKLNKYEHFLSNNIEDLISQSQDISLFDRANQTLENQMHDDLAISPIPVSASQQFFDQQELHPPATNNNNNQQAYISINMNAIINLFINKEFPTLICAVLQALRWRITKTKGAYTRREIIVSYAHNDILGCQIENEKLQDSLLKFSNNTRAFALRMINSIASDYFGRSYLIQSDNLVQQLINILKNQGTDTSIRRNTLGALQKLSLRKRPQIIMIQNDVISWILQTLKIEKETLSEYSYEYITALFMNLALRRQGKSKCEDPQEKALPILSEILEHENPQVRTYVNGTLYSILSRNSLREEARAMGMIQRLQYLTENSDQRFTKQLQYILQQLIKDEEEDDDENEEDEESAEDESMEVKIPQIKFLNHLPIKIQEDNDVDDIDQEEELGQEQEQEEFFEQQEEQILVGEDLLMQQFALTGPQAVRQNNLTQSIIEENMNQRNTSQSIIKEKKDGFFNRPTTPSMMHNKDHSIHNTSSNNIQNGASNSQPPQNVTNNHNNNKQNMPQQLINQLHQEQMQHQMLMQNHPHFQKQNSLLNQPQHQQQQQPQKFVNQFQEKFKDPGVVIQNNSGASHGVQQIKNNSSTNYNNENNEFKPDPKNSHTKSNSINNSNNINRQSINALQGEIRSPTQIHKNSSNNNINYPQNSNEQQNSNLGGAAVQENTQLQNNYINQKEQRSQNNIIQNNFIQAAPKDSQYEKIDDKLAFEPLPQIPRTPPVHDPTQQLN